MRFLEGFYIYVVTETTVVAEIAGYPVFRVEKTKLLAVDGVVPEKHPLEQRYVDLFLTLDLTKNFYFSYGYDLTRTLQQNMTVQADTYQDMFMWNHYLLQNGFDDVVLKSSPWTVPLIHGFIQQSSASLYDLFI